MLIVEIGTAAPDSESFASVVQATDYHAKRGNSDWAVLTAAQQEAALRNATGYMEEVYRLRWTGYRIKDTQALSWPRYEVQRPDSASATFYGYGYGYYDFKSVPSEVIAACCILALKASVSELAPDLDRPTTTEVVGPIRVDYAQGTRETVRFRAVDLLLAPLLKTSGMGLKVTRA